MKTIDDIPEEYRDRIPSVIIEKMAGNPGTIETAISILKVVDTLPNRQKAVEYLLNTIIQAHHSLLNINLNDHDVNVIIGTYSAMQQSMMQAILSSRSPQLADTRRTLEQGMGKYNSGLKQH